MREITQAQYDTAKQTHRKVYVHINLLNFKKQIIESIEGRVVSGTLTSDANSNMRNTCDIQMVVTDSSFNVESGGKVWIDRFIQVYVGVENTFTGEIIWTNKGLYLLNQPTYGYDAVSKMLSFQGVDLMALMTDMRSGMLTEAYVIPTGTNVRQVVTTIVTMNGFNEYVIEECRNSDGSIQPVPYDMEFDVGATWWDVLEALQSILPNYQMYFDVDGVFHYEPTPYKGNEPVRMNDDIWKENVISESVSYDFESVKNSVKVLGRTHSVNYYSTAYRFYEEGPFIHVEGDPNEYRVLSIDVPGVPEQPGDGTLIGFVAEKDLTGPFFLWVGGKDIATGRLLNDDGSPVMELPKDEYWVFSYKSPKTTGNQSGDWTFLGHVQAVGEWMDDNPRSPFFVGNPAGEIKIVLYGGDYDNIMSDDLARQRAEWEIYQRCRMNDSITLTSVPIYWSEVNWMVSYTPLGQKVVNQYLIRSITTDLTHDGTQTYNLVRWYPYYIQYVPATSEVLVRIYTDDKSTGNTAGAVHGNVDLVLSITKGQKAKSAQSSAAKSELSADFSIVSNANSSAAKPAEYSGSLTDIYADLWAKIPMFSGGNLTLAKISSNAVQIGSSPISASNAPMKSSGAAKSDDGIGANADVGVISGDNSKANAIESMPTGTNEKIVDTGESSGAEVRKQVAYANYSAAKFVVKPTEAPPAIANTSEQIEFVSEANVVASNAVSAQTVSSIGELGVDANVVTVTTTDAKIEVSVGIVPTVATPNVLPASSIASELAAMSIEANALAQYPRFKQVGDTVYIYRPMRWRQDGGTVYIDYTE